MGQRVKVTSLEAVDDFAAALRSFRHDGSRILESLQLGIHRAVQWIQQDQRQYWKQQLRKSDQKVQEAKLALERCLIFRGGDDSRGACTEEKRALERAKRRHQLCRDKLEIVRRWSRDVERAVLEYKAEVGELRQWLETDAARSLGLLDRISRTLQEYVAAEPSAQVERALARLPWTDEEWERVQKEEGPPDDDSASKPGRTGDATDAGAPGHERGSEEEAEP